MKKMAIKGLVTLAAVVALCMFFSGTIKTISTAKVKLVTAKQGKLEEVIRHSVELGVTEVVPFFSRYCVAAPKKENVKCERYNRIAAEAAKQAGTTRAVAAMHRAAQEHPGAVLAVGNAPTALLTIADQIEAGLRPALVIGVPVGFVNVVESKERLFATCEAFGVPAIVAMGRKGGSNVAAAICNALIYSASEMLDPAARGWRG